MTTLMEQLDEFSKAVDKTLREEDRQIEEIREDIKTWDSLAHKSRCEYCESNPCLCDKNNGRIDLELEEKAKI